jgi:hypothetical protein
MQFDAKKLLYYAIQFAQNFSKAMGSKKFEGKKIEIG